MFGKNINHCFDGLYRHLYLSMNFIFVIPCDKLDVQKKILYGEKKTNTVMEGSFTKMLYLDSCMTMNAIHITFPIHIEKDTIMSKMKCLFHPSTVENQRVITKMASIEELLLTQYALHMRSNKTPIFFLKDQLTSGNVRIYQGQYLQMKDTIMQVILKVSGVWESKDTFGLTFKFLKAYHILSPPSMI